MSEIDEQKVADIKESYAQMVTNVREALELAGVPRRMTYFYTYLPPKLEDMIPEDAVNFYHQTRDSIILYLHEIGFSQREIARRLGGAQYHIVNEVLKDNAPENKFATPEEVSKPLQVETTQNESTETN